MEKLMEVLKNVNDTVDYENESDLVASGIFTSFEIFQCIMDIEEAYDISIPPQEIMPENFKSIDTIMAMIKRCL